MKIAYNISEANEMKTYISLFSSAGVGCYAFKQDGFTCIATNELIERRLNIQKYNNKCKYETGYICGDITKKNTKVKLYSEIDNFKKKEKINDVDVVIATPPCQGMSVANHKKTNNEIKRNSLVVESISIINDIKPKFFVFENVPQFLKTMCTDLDGIDKPIYDAIKINLGDKYLFRGQTINFKNYGGNSSRTRTLVIGVRKDLSNFVTPLDLFPNYKQEKTLREVIGGFKSLNEFNEFDENDFYHSFRPYSEHMRSWIHDLKEGESAFDNIDPMKRPHRIVDGIIVENVNKNGDKYTRQFWDKVGPCIHTRNDQLASQNTIHPVDDRVFSIRELMELMTIPKNFKWVADSFESLNALSKTEKIKKLKKEEMNIRQSIGEAVPTNVMREISSNISNFLSKINLSLNEVKELIERKKLWINGNLINFLTDNLNTYNFSTLTKIIELSNARRNETSSFYTDKFLIEKMYDSLPDFSKQTINILEPSVGGGSFIPYIIKKYADKEINLYLCDIDSNTLEALKVIFPLVKRSNVKIKFILDDFLLHEFNVKFDLIIGNPPFSKINKNYKNKIDNQKWVKNKASHNLASYFIEKSITISSFTFLIMPKNLLNTPEYSLTRNEINNFSIDYILDFGEKGFKDVLVETISILISTIGKQSVTTVESITKGIKIKQNQQYYTDSKYPYWIIYRDDFFDQFANNMVFNVFTFFRDRQITNSITKLVKSNIDDISVIKSRNISDDGTKINDIPGYNSYINKNLASKLQVFKFLNEDVFMAPNMTYKIRLARKPIGTITNGSVAILIPKNGIKVSNEDLLFFSSDSYRKFMDIARNFQTRSLNIDSTSIYFYGLRR